MATAAAVALVVAFASSGLLIERNLFWQDDMLNQYLPATREAARAILNGEWPILTLSCWSGASLAGEYQPAVFSLFEVALSTLVWSLPLPIRNASAVLVITHLALLAAGSFRLARSRGLTHGAGFLVVIVASLNGWLASWAAVTWYPALTSFSWVPWAWWGLERALAGRVLRPWRFAPAGVFLYLILSAGWPFTCLMIGVVSAWLSVTTWITTRRILAIWPILAAWTVGLGLATPAIAMLIDYIAQTPRGAAPPGLQLPMMVPLEGFAGMALPAYQTYWHNLFVWAPRHSIELAGAFTPFVFWTVVLARRGRVLLREQTGLLCLLAIVTVLTTSPGLGSFRFSFRWLPLWHLVFALLAGQAISSIPRDALCSVRLSTAALALGLTVLTTARALLIGFDQTSITHRMASGLLVLCGAWLIVEWVVARRMGGGHMLPALVFTLGSLAWTYLQVPPTSEVPTWHLAPRQGRAEPLDPTIRYLSVFGWFDLFRWEQTPDRPNAAGMHAGGLRPGYNAMHANLQVLNGYSGMGHAGLSPYFEFGIQGQMSPTAARRTLQAAAAGSGLLRLAAVDGLIVHHTYESQVPALQQNGWRREPDVLHGIVLRREGAPTPRARAVREAAIEPTRADVVRRVLQAPPADLPVVLSAAADHPAGHRTFASAQVTLLREERRRSVARVEVAPGTAPALVLFARPWLEGWRASIDGMPLEVEETSALVPGVKVPAGARGVLTLEYSPPILERAVLVALTTLLATLAIVIVLVRRTVSRSRDSADEAQRV